MSFALAYTVLPHHPFRTCVPHVCEGVTCVSAPPTPFDVALSDREATEPISRLSKEGSTPPTSTSIVLSSSFAPRSGSVFGDSQKLQESSKIQKQVTGCEEDISKERQLPTVEEFDR